MKNIQTFILESKYDEVEKKLSKMKKQLQNSDI